MAGGNVESYNQRVKRIQDAAQLKVPDRVPISVEDQGVFIEYGGLTWAQAMYDVKKAKAAAKKFYLDLQQDTHSPPMIITPGQVYDILDFKQMKWPGAELADNRMSLDGIYQFIEPGGSRYPGMSPDEYDWFLNDPTDYMLRGFWPKIAGSLQPLGNLSPLWPVNSYTRLELLAGFGIPEVADSLEKLIEAGRELRKFNEALVDYTSQMVRLGFPPRGIAACSAPFDYLGDYMLGTQTWMLELYDNPDQLLKLTDKVTPMILGQVIAQAKARQELLAEVLPEGLPAKDVFMHIHGGTGGFMSNEHFKKFYWPSLRMLLLGIIAAGFTPYVFAEGDYTERLEIIKDLPPGKVVWHIEADIFAAKKILGDTCCIEGGPPAAVMDHGTPADVRSSARKLIDVCAKDGGFIMGSSVSLLSAKYENIKALVEFTREYGVYR
jgi:uroporphyrinogen-III decarboxylase